MLVLVFQKGNQRGEPETSKTNLIAFFDEKQGYHVVPANDAVCSFLLHQQLPAAEGKVRSEGKNEKTMVQ